MFDLARLRDFANSSERVDFNIRLRRHLAVEDQYEPDFVQQSSSVSARVEKEFYKHIDKFTEHLDEIIRLVDDSDQDPSEEALTAEASAMQKALYNARLLFNQIKFDKPDFKTRAIGLTYAEAKNCYYRHIRPDLMSLKDLDIPRLDLFSFRSVRRGRGKEIIKPIEFITDYKQSLSESLEELLGLQTRDPILDKAESGIRETLYEELAALTRDLVDEAKTIIPPRKFPKDENNLPKGFQDFVKELNCCLAEQVGAYGYDLYPTEEVYQAIYGSVDLYEAIVGELLKIIEDTKNKKPSEDIKLLLLLFLMKLYGSDENSSTPEGLGSLLEITLHNQAMSREAKITSANKAGQLKQLELSYDEASKIVKRPSTARPTLAGKVFTRNHLYLDEKQIAQLGLFRPALLEHFEKLLNQATQERKDSWMRGLQSLGQKILDTVHYNAQVRINLPDFSVEDAIRVMQFVAIKISQNTKNNLL